MRKPIIVIILLFLLFTTQEALADDWTDTQKFLGATYLNFVGIDLYQSTNWIEFTEDEPRVIDSTNLYETNSFVVRKNNLALSMKQLS